jgi:hypothetical protein
MKGLGAWLLPMTVLAAALLGIGCDKPDDKPIANPCPWPSCITALENACPWTGEYTIQSDSSGTSSVQTACFANGVKVQTVVDTSTMPTTGEFTATTTTKKPSGETCYSTIQKASAAGGSIEYRDASGNLVASGTMIFDGHGNTTETLACSGGAPVTLGPACLVSRSQGTDGVCSF